MIDLFDLTLLIPIQIDCSERTHNLNIVLRYLSAHLNISVLVGEESPSQRIRWPHPQDNLKFFYSKNNESYFHRTRILNDLCKRSTTSIICLHDGDVVMHPNQYLEATELIRNKKADLVVPYDGTVYNLPAQEVGKIKSATKNIGFLKKVNLTKCRKRRANSMGGAIFFDKEKFIEGGMENENFRSWGAEDDELVCRFSKLGHNMIRGVGVLYHLDHPRGINSRMNNPYYKENMKHLDHIRDLTKDQLRDEIKNWRWLK